MRIFVVGASGAIGMPLVRQLVARGHQVVGACHHAWRAPALKELGAAPVVLDLLEVEEVRAAVAEARPDAVVHQATALTDVTDFRHLDRSFAATNRLRVRGTDNLLDAAHAARVPLVVAQSFANHRYERSGCWVKTEDDPLDPDPAPTMRETAEAMRYLDEAVRAAGGAVLRYGNFYGPEDDALVRAVRNRQFPIVGSGDGRWCFVHLDDAATATVLALEQGASGVFNIVDDDPAPIREWLPALADAVGGPPPRHVPAWAARLFAGEGAVLMATQSRGAANIKARGELGWAPAHSTWRTGFDEAHRREAAA